MAMNLQILFEVFLFPILAIGIWTLLFNSKNSFFTRLVVEGGYILVVIPLMVLTFLSIPAMGFLFYAKAQGIDREVTNVLLGVIIGISLIVEYFYIKRMIKQLEEKEHMPIMDIIRRELKKETHEKRKSEKIKTKVDAKDYFDAITVMNKERRELDREEKEKLRKALLGDIEHQPSSTNTDA